MHHHHHEIAPEEIRTPVLRFTLITVLELAVALGIFYWIAPNVFRDELGHPWAILGWILVFGLPMSLFEYLYHRYLLHSSILPFMASQHRAHRTHHGLTNVKAAVTPVEPEKLANVESKYPILEPEQEESMMFPWYALPIFYVIFLGLLAPTKLLFPGSPIILSVIIATTLYLVGYEMWHAILHFPYNRFWKPLMQSRKVGKVTKYVYSFHLMHHWRPTTNLAVVGYWGIALWDHVFRTHKRPEMLPLDRGKVRYVDCKISQPRWPISQIDKWEKPMYKFSRSLEGFLAKLARIRK
jgi:hemolysin III